VFYHTSLYTTAPLSSPLLSSHLLPSPLFFYSLLSTFLLFFSLHFSSILSSPLLSSPLLFSSLLSTFLLFSPLHFSSNLSSPLFFYSLLFSSILFSLLCRSHNRRAVEVYGATNIASHYTPHRSPPYPSITTDTYIYTRHPCLRRPNDQDAHTIKTHTQKSLSLPPPQTHTTHTHTHRSLPTLCERRDERACSGAEGLLYHTGSGRCGGWREGM
jgi:hypothetical protein